MITVNIQEAAAQMPRLFQQALAGEHIVFCKDSVPVIEMKSMEVKPMPRAGGERMLGNPPFPMVIPDSFFEPLPNDMLDAFEGKYSD